MRKKKLLHNKVLLIAFSLLLVANVTGCKQPKEEVVQQQPTGIVQEEVKKELTFDEYLNSLFVEDITDDLTSYTQFVQNPNDYGITEYSHGLKEPGYEEFQKDTKKSENELAALLTYDYNSLTKEQKQDYDIIKKLLEERIAIKDCAYFGEPLSTTTGDHIVAPGMISLYATRFFESMKENGIQDLSYVENYFDIYKAMGTYFQQVAAFEIDKAEHGIFMTSQRAKSVITVCNAVIQNQAADFVTSFEDEVLSLTWIRDQDKKTLIAKNCEIGKKCIVEGYQAIIDAMNECMSKADQWKGYYTSEEGKTYYRYLLKSKVNADISPEEMASMLEEHLTEWNAEQAEIMKARPKIMTEITSVMGKHTDSDKLATMLTEKIKADFPEIELNWGVKDMPVSMNGFAAGLFYPPAFDSTVPTETVYAGTSLTPGTASYVQTIAHEGIPGHLYHYSFMKTLDLSDYRRLLAWSGFTGYLEGWTTYIENFGYHYAGLDDDQARILELQRLIELAVIQRVDIGVNYEGWQYPEISSFLKVNSPTYLLMASYIKNMVEDAPGIMSSYVVGYIYLTDIKADYKEKVGDAFTNKSFHEAYLSVGPATYEQIRAELGL